MLLADIWKRVMPEGSPEAHRRADELLLQYELSGLNEGISELYPQVKETLAELQREGVKLFVASNGLEEYIQAIVKTFGMDELFTGLYSAGKRHRD